jgi:hypothetical protein
MARIKDTITHAIPWVEPILDYFDWRKQVIALVATLVIGVWSFVIELSWPAIIVLAFGMLVSAAYALTLPALIKLIHVGVEPRPNHSIWKYKKRFTLFQAAYLLANREPRADPSLLNGDAAAWYENLREAIMNGEMRRIPTAQDGMNTRPDGYHPTLETPVEASELKKFCMARGRNPEFLN